MKTFIFGAGASIPFFNPALNTDYLTHRVCDKTEWDNVIKKYIKSGTDRKMFLTSDTVYDIIKRIVRLTPDVNFEKVVEIIDKISSFGMDWLCNKTMLSNFISVMDDESANRLKGKYRGEWTIIPFLAREIIAESIINKQENEKSSDYAKLSGLQHNLFASVCKQDAQVNVMSLNYDDCIYDSL